MAKPNYNKLPQKGPLNDPDEMIGTTQKDRPEYLSGPLADMNAIPYRGAGVAAHGLDTDVPTAAYEDHPGPDDMTDGGAWQEWIPPDPVLVSVVDMPIETEERHSRIITLFGGNETYTFTSVGVFDNIPPRTLLPKDDTRVSATIYALPTPALAVATGNGAQYGFLISSEQNCTTGILLGVGGANAVESITVKGKSAVFGRLVPLAAFDSAKTNNYSLAAIAETSVLGSNRVR